MESVRSRRGREKKSPERLIRSINHQQEEVSNRKTTPILRRCQVVYYLTRNGHLEHPHFMEVISPVNHPLRLRDVINRLMILRGKSMPLLYSWSCKRSYRNGFVWNDLAHNDVIYPSDSAEYVLKGSKLTEKFEDVPVSKSLSGPIQERPKSQLFRSKPSRRNKTASFDDAELYVGEEDEEEDGEYELYEEKTSYTSSTTPKSRCSRGVSTETIELAGERQQKVMKTIQGILPVQSDSSELTRPNSPELTRSDPALAVLDVLKRVEDGDPVDPGSCRSGSVFLHMISCGGHMITKYAPSLNPRQKETNLRKGVLCKNNVVKKAVVEDEREMIKFMSENPRFGNPQAEEKEYFSGSIVEAVSQERVTPEPVILRRSNSFNEERSKIMEMAKEMKKNKEEKVTVKLKCIPRRKSSSCLMASSK